MRYSTLHMDIDDKAQQYLLLSLTSLLIYKDGDQIRSVDPFPAYRSFSFPHVIISLLDQKMNIPSPQQIPARARLLNHHN